MPDWLAHLAFAYILCRILRYRFPFDTHRTMLVMVGSLIPDLVKIELLFDFFGIEMEFLTPLHTPIGSVLSAAIVASLFSEMMLTFSLFLLGAATHLGLDLLMGHVEGGIHLLFPFSWDTYQLGIIQCDEWRLTVVLVVVALGIFLVERYMHSKES